jgi:hypothetical protein
MFINDKEWIYLFSLVMELSPEKKMTETLHQALRSIKQFPHHFFFSGDTPSPNKKTNKQTKTNKTNKTNSFLNTKI